MSAQLSSHCQFCSALSKSNGEDPIGTATPCDTWLIAEIPLPWTEERLTTDPILKQLYSLFQEVSGQSIQVMPIAIAPDREYSVPGYTRVLHYFRPAQSFVQFERQEFLVAETQLPQLATALFLEPDQLHHFEPCKQPVRPIWSSHLSNATGKLCNSVRTFAGLALFSLWWTSVCPDFN
jgi:hypothetical protein